MGLANAEDSEPRKPGSIAYRVLRAARIAVVVVPHSDAQTSRAEAGNGHAFESLGRLVEGSPQH
jgi:hypothetical protein